MNGAATPLGLEAWGTLKRFPRAVTVGNFDGVHRGHQLLLDRLSAVAQENSLSRCAVTFHPHPATVVAPHRAPRLLMSLEERVALLRRHGADEVVVLRFDEAFARVDAETFARDFLAGSLAARHVTIGENFRFGNGQGGDLRRLQSLGESLGFGVEGIELAHWRGSPVSSSEIRRQLSQGNVGRATRLLGRPYALRGPVVRGRGVGSAQTVPTLNLGESEELMPGDGVYVTRTHDEEAGAIYPSITNVGFRPTFDDGHPERTVETFLLGPLAGPPQWIRVEFLRWVRAERAFESPAALRAQILRDVARAQAFHRRSMLWQPEVLEAR